MTDDQIEKLGIRLVGLSDEQLAAVLAGTVFAVLTRFDEEGSSIISTVVTAQEAFIEASGERDDCR